MGVHCFCGIARGNETSIHIEKGWLQRSAGRPLAVEPLLRKIANPFAPFPDKLIFANSGAVLDTGANKKGCHDRDKVAVRENAERDVLRNFISRMVPGEFFYGKSSRTLKPPERHSLSQTYPVTCLPEALELYKSTDAVGK